MCTGSAMAKSVASCSDPTLRAAPGPALPLPCSVVSTAIESSSRASICFADGQVAVPRSLVVTAVTWSCHAASAKCLAFLLSLASIFFAKSPLSGFMAISCAMGAEFREALLLNDGRLVSQLLLHRALERGCLGDGGGNPCRILRSGLLAACIRAVFCRRLFLHC